MMKGFSNMFLIQWRFKRTLEVVVLKNEPDKKPLGQIGEKVIVAPGYYRHYLEPRKLAKSTNTPFLKRESKAFLALQNKIGSSSIQQKQQQQQEEEEREREKQAQQQQLLHSKEDLQLIKKLGLMTLKVERYTPDVNSKTPLKPVTAEQLAVILQRHQYLDVEKNMITVPDDKLSVFGSHVVEVTLKNGLKANLKINLGRRLTSAEIEKKKEDRIKERIAAAASGTKAPSKAASQQQSEQSM